MTKLTEEQKKKRAETRRLNELKRKEERKVQFRLSQIKDAQGWCTPEPTRFFEKDELVEFGNHQNSKILEVFDGGKFYEVYSWGIIPKGTQGAGNPTSSTNFIPWFSLYKKDGQQTEESFFSRNKFQLNYMQQGISSLLNKVYGYGVDFDAEYQRELVWDDDDKTALIDSISEGRDIGKFLFMDLPFESGKPVDQIVDGKQRLTTICEFYEDRFVWRGKKFSELNHSDQFLFTEKAVSVAEVKTMPRKDILELFLFVNDTGKPIAREHLDKVKTMLTDIEK